MNGALVVNSAPAVDPNPNTTQPEGDRIQEFPLAMGPPTVVWLAAVGGAPTVEVWFAPLGTTPRTWVRGPSVALVADIASMQAPGLIPAGMPLFFRVTVVGGATKILAGLTRS